MNFRCNVCGKNFQRDYNHLTRAGGRFRCPQCGIMAGAKTKRYSVEDVDRKIAERGYTRIGEYIDAATPFSATCKRGHQVNLTFSNFLIGHSGCKICGNLDRMGENAYNWKGGRSEVIEVLRKSIKDWAYQVLKRDKFLCQVSGRYDNLEVHHLVGFNTLIEQASSETGVPILQKLEQYNSLEDFERLKKRVQELHTPEIGITLTKDIHNDFHNKYGRGNNTEEQFKEYLTASTYPYQG